MIKDDMTPFQHRVTFKDDGITRTQFTDDRRYYERLVSQHGHLTDLVVEPLTLTGEQQTRLAEIASTGLGGHDAALYVQYGSTESGGPYHDTIKLQVYRHAMVAPTIQKQRKDAEAGGVVVNGIRYAGDQGSRQTLSDAIMAADDSGSPTFASWKDSDGGYHADHPVADVKDALRAIGQRRPTLIALESLYVGQIVDEQIDIHELDWSTEYD